jgi:hypothetical protein
LQRWPPIFHALLVSAFHRDDAEVGVFAADRALEQTKAKTQVAKITPTTEVLFAAMVRNASHVTDYSVCQANK